MLYEFFIDRVDHAPRKFITSITQYSGYFRTPLEDVVVCLFHGDYGPPDPAFSVARGNLAVHGWRMDASQLAQARNLGEALAIQRHLLRWETVTWCHPGYSWVDQPVIGWFYAAAFLFVVLPYFLIRIGGTSVGFLRNRMPGRRTEDVSRLRF